MWWRWLWKAPKKWFWKVRKMEKKILLYRLLLVFAVTFGSTCLAILFRDDQYYYRLFPHQITVDLSNNYFAASEMNQILTGEFLVDNEKCRIPELRMWSDQVVPFFEPIPTFNCRNRSYFNLTYVHNNMVVINEALLHLYGYNLNEVECCYKTIERVEESKRNYTKKADNQFRYSISCHQMGKFTKPKSGFLKVFCEDRRTLSPKPRYSVFYENLHLVALLPEEPNTSPLSKKLQFWKNFHRLRNSTGKYSDKDYFLPTDKLEQPPNFLILGLDSTSRLNFHRFLPRTKKIFKNLLKPVELRGYVKVGDNTFPNIVPFLSSFPLEELMQLCFRTPWHAQDECPYIWKQFAQNHYVTAHLEDSSGGAIFHSERTGFVTPPVDFYPRPFIVAAYRYYQKSYEGCVMHYRPEEIIIKYIVDLVTLFNSRGLPFYIFSWLTYLTHDSPSGLQAMDILLSEALLQLYEKDLLKNTILFVMGDHGYRYLEIRQTASGWFEDKLPAMFVRLPETILKSNPEWQQALEYNSHQLVTPFDMHEIFWDVLDRFGVSTEFLEVSEKRKIRSGGKIQRGISPLSKLPERNCPQANIPDAFCPCSVPVEYSNQDFLRNAAQAMIEHVRLRSPLNCSKLFVKEIFAAAALSYHPHHKMANYPSKIVIGLEAVPGNIPLEAVVTFNATKNALTKVSFILRMDRIRGRSCIKGITEVYPVLLTTYCHCPTKRFFLF